jgi:hypothetical protein
MAEPKPKFWRLRVALDGIEPASKRREGAEALPSLLGSVPEIGNYSQQPPKLENFLRGLPPDLISLLEHLAAEVERWPDHRRQSLLR